MKEFLLSGQVGQIELNEARKNRAVINERWSGLGMLDGLKGDVKENVAMLFENEAKHLIQEAVASDNSGSFETVVFPIIRRVFSKLLANDIVSVQAMNLPVGKVFYMLPVTSEREWRNEDGTQLTEGQELDGVVGAHRGLMGYERTDRRNGNQYNRFYLPDEAVCEQAFVAVPESGAPVTLAATTYDAALAEVKELGEGYMIKQVAPRVAKPMGKTLYDLFYNDFLFDNSKGKVRIKVAKDEEIEKVAFDKFGRIAKLEKVEDLRLFADKTLRNAMLKVKGFSAFRAGKLTGPDGNEMDSEAFLASLKVIVAKGSKITDLSGETMFDEMEEIPVRVVTQKYGKGIVEYDCPCDAEGCIYLDLDLAKPTASRESLDSYVGVDAESFSAATLQAVWCQYDSLELETEMGEVGFKLESTTVSVESRKLRATWSPEMAQDVNAFHNIDAEAELTALLSEQIAAEIDREILKDLRKAAPWKQRWNVNGWRTTAGFSTNYTQKDWNQELITAVNQVSAQIQKATLRGGANFIVVSSEISALFNNLEYFHVSDASAESDQYNMGIERIGAINNQYQVYVDPYSPAWSIIIGHKGKSLLDTGYIYAPYIPMQLTPTIYNPENFAPVKGIMTRYAKKCVNTRFFGSVVVDGLRQWDINELR